MVSSFVDENDDYSETEENDDDDYTDDEEVAAVYKENLKNKTSRTSPQFEVDPLTAHTKRMQRLECTKCVYKATNKAQLNKHIEENHNQVTYQCVKCTFKGNTTTDLAWHREVIHQRKEHFASFG